MFNIIVIDDNNKIINININLDWVNGVNS